MEGGMGEMWWEGVAISEQVPLSSPCAVRHPEHAISFLGCTTSVATTNQNPHLPSPPTSPQFLTRPLLVFRPRFLMVSHRGPHTAQTAHFRKTAQRTAQTHRHPRPIR